jgi:hypothetical protein
MTTLNQRNRGLLVLAIGIAIEHQYRAIEACSSFDQSLVISAAVAEHQRTLREFEKFASTTAAAEPTTP